MNKRTKRAKPKRKRKQKHTQRRQEKIIIPTTSSIDEQLIKTKINPDAIVRSANDLMQSVRSQTFDPVTKSYTPGINKLLVSNRPEMKAMDIFGCGLEKTLIDGENLFKRQNSKVKVADGPVCKRWNSKEAKDFMLDNLRAAGNFERSNVVTPQQIDSNCWFNTFFVTFFISDKGRKFFRFFRELMIRGEDVKHNKLPPDIAHAFFFLNACIEAAYNNKNVALAMNTNHVILKIYDSIRKRDIGRLNDMGLADVDEAGNPFDYYASIMDYINTSDEIRYKKVDSHRVIESLFTSSKAAATSGNSGTNESALPELYAVEIRSKLGVPIPTAFKIGRHKYVLDSSVIIDTQGRHFCSTLTCSGEQMGFDGGSFARLEPFKWKPLLNQNRDWTFEGSIFDEDKSQKIWWNFQQSYKMLFYYRM